MKREDETMALDNRIIVFELEVKRCIIALHDLGSRDGATRKGVIDQLKEEGFTTEHISEAAKRMG